MRTTFCVAAALAAVSFAGTASAQVTVIERDEPRVIVRDRPADVIERREVESDRPPGGCESKTVTRTDEDGATTTVRKERCD